MFPGLRRSRSRGTEGRLLIATVGRVSEQSLQMGTEFLFSGDIAVLEFVIIGIVNII